MATALTRAVTHSEFDHVGIIIRYEYNIYIMEAVGGPGVRLISWKSLSKYVGEGKFYERICFRHVRFNRSPEIMSKFS